MPELPEVEIAARSLASQVTGRTIVGLERLDWDRMLEPLSAEAFEAMISGRCITQVARRAKWVLLHLANDLTMAIHLRMSGNLTVHDSTESARTHVHLIICLDDGRRIFFDDERKFGRVRLLDPAGLGALDAAHGPEPLAETFTAATLAHILAGRRTKIKPLLLDQRLIAGMGNIYASEALWLARLHPLLPAVAIDANGVAALHQAIRAILTQAIQHEGSSLRNYRNGYGRRGQQQDYFLVYDRAGQPCQRCGTTIQRVVIAQRSTFFCPVCQRLPELSSSESR